MKQKVKYVCSECGTEHPKWMGQCSGCGAWSTLEEQQVLAKETKTAKRILGESSAVQKLGKINVKNVKRLKTGFDEVDSALAGGLIPDQVVLFSGEPGVGKSTLLLQVAVDVSQSGQLALYASGEESASQIVNRAERLFQKKEYKDVEFVAAPGVHGLVGQIEALKPQFVIVDSIQTMYDESLSSLPGSLSQIKSCTSVLVNAAKQLGFILVLVGHINKEGSIAGPKVLEHLVDTVLQLEGERDGEYRILRVLKNRFGSTGEVGILVMTETGLADMDGSHNIFAGAAEDTIGGAKTLVVEGNRPIIVQVQALTNSTVFAYPKRVAEGLPVSRLQLICAILERFTDVRLADKDVYIRTAGGYRLSDPSTDLAVAAAIISSMKNAKIPQDSLFVGEISLGGKTSIPSAIRNKLDVVARQNISNIILPKTKFPAGLKGKVGVEQIADVARLSKIIR